MAVTYDIDPSKTTAMQGLWAQMQSLHSGGNEAAARDLYNTQKSAMGFSDGMFAQGGTGGAYSAQNVVDWSSQAAPAAAVPTPAPVAAASNPYGSASQPAPQGNSYVAPAPASAPSPTPTPTGLIAQASAAPNPYVAPATPAKTYAYLGDQQKMAVIAEAERLSEAQGITPMQAIYNYAQTNGISNAGIDTMLGYAPGSADGWLQTQGAGAGTPTSKYTALSATEQARVTAEARRLAGISGRTPEQELYSYAQKNGISNAGVDTMMGFAPGSTEAWLRQQPAPQGNSYKNPSSGGATIGTLGSAVQDVAGEGVRPSAIGPKIVGSGMPAPLASTPAQWSVTPNMTVQQQTADIINADGPLMQQARSAAMQQVNARGLVNSSMGIGAGQMAVLASAADLGKQDANTYASAGQFNAGQANTFNNNALDRAQQTSERMGTQAFNAGEKVLDRTFNSGENALDRNLTTTQNDANRTFTAGQSALDRNLTVTQKDLDRASTTSESALNRGFTAAENTANRAAEVAKYNFDATTRTSLAGLANSYDAQMQKDSSVAQAYNNTVSQMGAIDGDPNLLAPAKSVAKNRLIASFEAYAKVRGLNMDLVFEKFVEDEKPKDDTKTGLFNTAAGGAFAGGGGDGGSGGGDGGGSSGGGDGDGGGSSGGGAAGNGADA